MNRTRNIRRALGTSVAALALIVACTESRTPAITDPIAPKGPNLSATVPFNNEGACLASDAYNSGLQPDLRAGTPGVNDINDLADPAQNCTSNDINIAQATIIKYSFNGVDFINFTGQPVTCTEGSTIFLDLNALVDETATSERTDVGVWIATDGGNARTGTCNHYNLLNADVSDEDGDSCGDMNDAENVNVPLGIIEAVCQTGTPTATNLHIGSCLAWTEPGNDRVCPLPSQGATPDGFRWGTVPGATSKCNCAGFDVPVTVLKTAKIELIKSCVPSTDPGTFDLTIDGNGAGTGGTWGDNRTCTGATSTTGQQTVGAGTNVNPGATHDVMESGFSIDPSNYTSTVSCTKNGSAYIASQAYTAGTNLSVQTNPNDLVVCTFVNTRKPSLTLVKRIVNNNGGTAVVADFGITTNAPGTYTFGSGVADGANTLKYTTNTVLLNAPGTFSLSENNVAGYNEGTWSCTGVAGANGGAYNAGSVVIAAGEQAVCTITNDDQGGSLQLVKRIVNDHGGTKVVGDFGITTNAPGTLTFGSGVADGANTLKYTSNALGVNAGTYSLVENNVAGYTEGSWDCTGNAGAEVGTFNAGSVVVGLGETVVCTITNNDDPASLIIVKRVVNNDGGTATVTNFNITTSAGALTFGSGVADGANTLKYTANTLTGLSAGSKTLVEANVVGYAEGTWGCTGGTGAVVSTFSAGSVVLNNGETVTCTITNDDSPASLQLVKRITNDHGGTKVVGDFGITTNAPGTLSFGSGSADGANTLKYSSNVLPVPAGTYSLVENNVAGYTEGSWDCTGNAGAEVGTFNAGSVVVGLGEAVVCTITNNDDPAALIIVKRIVNNNGGTKVVGDFNITTSAGALTFGSGVADGANTLKYTANTLTGLSAGSKTLVEANVAGYTEGTWGCTGGTGAVVSTFSAGSVVLNNGETVTCTITNDDQPATLTIVKVVIGTGVGFDFTTSTSSATPLPSSFTLTPANNSSAQQQFTDLNAGTYNVTETVPAGYVLTDLACTGSFTATYDPTTTKTASPVLPNGGAVTCTFTNQGTPSETTRTQGFWSTHSGLTYAVWFGGTSGGHTFAGVTDKTLCGRSIDTIGKLLGGFWSNIAQTTTKTKRSELDQARMRLLQQLLAAILNNAAFGSSPTGSISIADAKAAYCGTDIDAINAAAAAMAAFNEGGDDGDFTPGGSANGKVAKDLANLVFWNVLP